MSPIDSVLNFSDADLKAAMRRAVEFTAILAVMGFLGITALLDWQTGALFAVGALVSLASIYEWQRLIAVINARLDQQQMSRSSALVVVMFFLRLGIAVLIIYASLRCFHGSLYALVAGLGLAIVALTVEALRMLRS